MTECGHKKCFFWEPGRNKHECDGCAKLDLLFEMSADDASKLGVLAHLSTEPDRPRGIIMLVASFSEHFSHAEEIIRMSQHMEGSHGLCGIVVAQEKIPDASEALREILLLHPLELTNLPDEELFFPQLKPWQKEKRKKQFSSQPGKFLRMKSKSR